MPICDFAGHAVYFGDAGREELLEKVGAQRARAFAVTINIPLAAERWLPRPGASSPTHWCLARAVDTAHAERLIALGAVGVIPETVEASLQLAARLLEGLDLPEETVSQRMAAMRAAEFERLTPDGEAPS